MAPERIDSSQSDDGERQALQALRAAHERAAKSTLDKKRAVLKEIEKLSAEYKTKVESSMSKYQANLKITVKEHKAAEKQILAEMETTRQELLQLLHGMKNSTEALANETIKTEEHIARKTAEIVKKQEELHESEASALNPRGGLLWGGDEVEGEEVSAEL